MAPGSMRAGGGLSRFSTGGAADARRKIQVGSELEGRTSVRGNPGKNGGKWRMNRRHRQLEKQEHKITQGNTNHGGGFSAII